jgi:hypothetical protein
MKQSLIGIVFTTTLQEEEPFGGAVPSCSVSHPRFPRVALLSFDIPQKSQTSSEPWFSFSRFRQCKGMGSNVLYTFTLIRLSSNSTWQMLSIHDSFMFQKHWTPFNSFHLFPHLIHLNLFFFYNHEFF